MSSIQKFLAFMSCTILLLGQQPPSDSVILISPPDTIHIKVLKESKADSVRLIDSVAEYHFKLDSVKKLSKRKYKKLLIQQKVMLKQLDTLNRK